MILNGGSYGGVLSPLTVAQMTRPRIVSVAATRAGSVGTSTPVTPPIVANCFRWPVGHTGFTGTSIWIDPASEMFVVFLSNRVHPDGKGDVGPLRGRVASIVAGSVTDTVVVERARAVCELLLRDRQGLRQFGFRDEGSGAR